MVLSKKMEGTERCSGILLAISSLPNPYGIGSFGQSAYQFVDFLVETEQTYWQILPLTTTSYGDSPYQSFSVSAGNIYFIDLDYLVQEDLLLSEELAEIDFGQRPDQVDYGLIYQTRLKLLILAAKRFLEEGDLTDYRHFVEREADWLKDYAEFMAIKAVHGMSAWTEWDRPIRQREERALEAFRQQLANQIEHHQVIQYFFYSQWEKLKGYANQKGIQIIGDLPIYVSEDSVEMWAQRDYFQVDEEGLPRMVAGTPPDAFSVEGQYWGNPLYDWKYHADQHYDWWIHRIQSSLRLYDLIRLDHFRGFEAYWAIPTGSETAAAGSWVKGPGQDFFNHLKSRLGHLPIIAEDLGVITEEVEAMRDSAGFPGMRVLQFGLDHGEDSLHLPHHYHWNTIAYVGTHDNETALGRYLGLSPSEQAAFDAYAMRPPTESPAQAMNRLIAQSVSRVAIYCMQDLLDLDNQARMNRPSRLGQNWQWRLKAGQLDNQLVTKLRTLTRRYFRSNPHREEAH